MEAQSNDPIYKAFNLGWNLEDPNRGLHQRAPRLEREGSVDRCVQHVHAGESRSGRLILN